MLRDHFLAKPALNPLIEHRWSLGVLIFELCAGTPPFMHDDRLTMFRKICSREIHWPKTFSSVS